MRTLKPTNSNKELTNKEYTKLQEQIDALIEKTDDLETELNAEEQELDAYKEDNLSSFSTGTINADNGNINNITADEIESNSITTPSLEATAITTESATADYISSNTLNVQDKITAKEIRATEDVKIDGDLTVEGNVNINNYNVGEAVIGDATIVSADITEANITEATVDTANITEATITEANITEATADFLEVNERLRANKIEAEKEEVFHIDGKYESYAIQPSVNSSPVWIEIPIIKTGSAKLYAVDVNNEFIFGLNISYAGTDNATIQYKERNWSEEHPDCLDNNVYLFEGKLYFHCMKNFCKIYWKLESSDENYANISTSSTIPIDASQAEHFLLKNGSGTIFTRYVQIGENGEGVLTLSPTSWLESTDEQVQYDPSQNVNFGFYAPDQDLDKGASPEFHTIKLDTERKTVVRATEEGVLYTQEEASVADGTLVPEPKLIEADDLYNYNGNSYALTQYEQNGSFTKIDVDVLEKSPKTVYASPKSFKINIGGGYNSYPSNKVYARSAYSNLDILYQNLNIQLLKEGATDPLADWTADSTEVITTAQNIINTPGYLVALELSRATFTSATAGNRRFTREIIRTEDGVEDYYWCVDDQSNIYGSDNGASYSAVRNFSNNAYTGAEPNLTFKTDAEYLTYLQTLFDKVQLSGSTLQFFIYEQNGSYYISTYSTSIEFSRTIQRINKVYQSLQEALDDIKNVSYPISTVNHTFTLNVPVTTYVPLTLKNGKTLGVGKINPHPYTGIPNRWPCVINQTVYYFKKTFETTKDVIQEQSIVPEFATLENSDSNVKKYVYIDTVGYAEVIKSTSGSNTTYTIQYPAYMQKIVNSSFESWTNATYIYNTSSGLLTFATDFDLFTAPATINKFEEIIVETPLWGKATWEDIDYETTDHPITNLGNGTVVHGSETVGTDLTVRKNTVLGSAEGELDPNTQQPIQTNTTVKGTADFKKDVQVGDNNATANIRVKGGIYRYNNTLQDYEEINNTYQRAEEKGLPDGYAPLDNNARIPRNYMPYDVMEYRGSWDASSGVFPQETAQDPLQVGDTYKVSTAGTINGQYYGVGDEITYNGSTWDYYENNKVILGTTDLGVVGCVWLG